METSRPLIPNLKSILLTLTNWPSTGLPLRMPMLLPLYPLLPDILFWPEGIRGEPSWNEVVLMAIRPAMIDPERRTIAQMFSANGYNTACIGKWHLGWDWGYTNNGRSMKDIDFSLPIKNGPADRGFDYYFGIPASLDISPYVYVENNKATSIPDHVIEPQKKNLALLMHGGMAGADFKPEECFPNIIRHSLNYINEQKDSKKPFFLIFAYYSSPHPYIAFERVSR